MATLGELTLFEDPEKAGALIEQRIWDKPPDLPKHSLTIFYTEECPHCHKVIPIVEEYVQQHPEIVVHKVNAATDEGTNRLESVLGGALEVPAVVVDNTFLIRGDVLSLVRLTMALGLSENLPIRKEESEKWLLRK